MKKDIANLTSNILNPFLVSLAVILLLSFKSAASTSDAIKWSAIMIAVSVLPVFAIIVYLVHKDRLEGIFINVRRQRNKIYLLASICSIAGFFILLSMGAPLVLVASLVAGLSAMLVFMAINLLWKISVHTAFVAGSVTTLTILFGSVGAVAAVLLPPLAWARTELEHHSIAQVSAGALLAALIVIVVFHFFGLI
jgi:hypothetical protein